jgi:DNA-binding transcriptional MerR regulator
MSGRSYLSIGDVLTLLRQEFQDITISKIRFLESQGLVNPERTPSGYRKFYEHDVERLRWVLRQQREHFLPLKVIKDRLDDGSAEADPDGVAPATASRPAKVAGRRQRHEAEPTGVGTSDDAHTGDPVLVGQKIAAEAEAASVSSHPAGEGSGLPGIGSAGESAAPVAAGATRAPDRPGLSAHRRAPDRGPVLELVNDGSTAGARAAGPDHANGTGEGAATARSGAPSSATAATGMVASSSATPGASPAGSPSGHSSGETTAEPAGTPAARAAKAGTAPAPASASPTDPPPAAPPGPSGTASTAPPTEFGGVSLTAEELAAASELDVTVVHELQEYGLLVASMVAGVEYFDGEALVVATAAGRFTRFGIEPRHLRLYKNAAEREAGFVEQVVLPLVRQRNPDARARAHETADELTRLGQDLRASLLRSALGNLLDG